MTDATSTPTVNPDWEAWQAQARERERLAQDVLPANKAALFHALAAARIAVVTVRFDVSCDSGQVEDIAAHAGDTAIACRSDEHTSDLHALIRISYTFFCLKQKS